VGAQLAVAYLLAARITSPRPWQRTAWRVATVVLIGGGVASNAFSSQSEGWWHKALDNDTGPVARFINQSRRPLVLSELSGTSLGSTIALGRYLHPDVRLWLVAGSEAPAIPDGFQDVFCLNPSGALRRKLEQDGTYRIVPVSVPGLWRCERLTPCPTGTGFLANPAEATDRITERRPPHCQPTLTLVMPSVNQSCRWPQSGSGGGLSFEPATVHRSWCGKGLRDLRWEKPAPAWGQAHFLQLPVSVNASIGTDVFVSH
jgi:hypothetical protein